MKDETVAQLLENCIQLINEDYKDWDLEGSGSYNYLAYGPHIEIVLEKLEELRKHFCVQAKFDKDLAKAYNETWPDFVDGNIV